MIFHVKTSSGNAPPDGFPEIRPPGKSDRDIYGMLLRWAVEDGRFHGFMEVDSLADLMALVAIEEIVLLPVGYWVEGLPTLEIYDGYRE